MDCQLNEEFSRIQRLPPYVFNIVNDLKMEARQRGEDIVDFGMGNPDQPTPKHIVEAMVEASRHEEMHRYSLSRGITPLREAICNWYKNRYDIDLDPETEAIVTIGSKEGLAHLAMAVVDKGDTVLVPNPSYPIHPYGFIIAGADVHHVPIGPDVDFFEELERSIKNALPKPKMLLINFPSNPTAQCVDLKFFEHVIAIAKEHNIRVRQRFLHRLIASWKIPENPCAEIVQVSRPRQTSWLSVFQPSIQLRSDHHTKYFFDVDTCYKYH